MMVEKADMFKELIFMAVGALEEPVVQMVLAAMEDSELMRALAVVALMEGRMPLMLYHLQLQPVVMIETMSMEEPLD
jgi:hypothetical protein